MPGFEFGPPRRDIWNPPVFGASAVLLGAAALFRAPLLLGPIGDAPVEEWEQMVSVNVMGLLYCAKAALPHLGPGQIGQR